LVAFAAEELLYYGQSGSEMYVNEIIESGKQVRLMINNDMIANTLSSDWKIFISNYQGCEWLTQLAKETAEKYTIIQPVLRPLTVVADGDCYYFYENGYPCVYLMEKDMNPYYHTANDLATNCEFDYCSEAIGITIGILLMADYQLMYEEDVKSQNEISLYPNPTNGILNLNLEKKLLEKKPLLMITTTEGQIITKREIDNSENCLTDLKNLTDGLYFVSIQAKDFRTTIKVAVCK